MKNKINPERILRYSLFSLVFSRGFLYVFFDSPYRSLFWNEKLFSPVVKTFELTWREYADISDPWISIFEKLLGVFLMFSAFFFLTLKREKKIFQYRSIQAAGFITMLHMVLQYIGHNHEFPMLPEYLLQASAPWLFLAFLPCMPDAQSKDWQSPSPETYFWAKVAVSMCFIGHGLYALGIPYQPASFVRLMTSCTFFSFETSSSIIEIVGLFDIALGIAVFIRPLEKITLGHMAFWGFITASARVISFVIVPGSLKNLNPWFFETTVRLIHGGAPLFLMILLQSDIIKKESPCYPKFKRWLVDWHFIPVVLILFLLSLAEISTHHSFTDTPDLELAEKLKEKKTKRYSYSSRIHNLNHVHLSDFKKSSSGYLYSDEMFYIEDIPTRLKLDLPPDQDVSLQNLNGFLENRRSIINSLKAQILIQFNHFYKSFNEQNLSQENILNFTEKIILTHDNAETLNAKIHVPWLNEKVINLEIDKKGQIINPESLVNN